MQAQAVLPGEGVLLDEAAAGQRLQEPVGRRLRDPEPAGDVRDPQLSVRGEALQHVERAADRLQAGAAGVRHRRPLGGGGAPCVLLRDDRHCWLLCPVSDGMTLGPAPWFDQRMRPTERNGPPVTLLARAASIVGAFDERSPVLSLAELTRRTGPAEVDRAPDRRRAGRATHPGVAGVRGVGGGVSPRDVALRAGRARARAPLAVGGGAAGHGGPARGDPATHPPGGARGGRRRLRGDPRARAASTCRRAPAAACRPTPPAWAR